MAARSGPSLKEVHHDLLEIREYLKDAAMFGRDLPRVSEEIRAYIDSKTFFDANLTMSGDTQEEAFRNVRGLIVDIFSDLDREPADRLGPGPKMQLQVLRSFIVRGQA
jgi:hypothetical protein